MELGQLEAGYNKEERAEDSSLRDSSSDVAHVSSVQGRDEMYPCS